MASPTVTQDEAALLCCQILHTIQGEKAKCLIVIDALGLSSFSIANGSGNVQYALAHLTVIKRLPVVDATISAVMNSPKRLKAEVG
ncbi:hypothetical protein BGZ99_002705, partial [Dissophora globulifera]